tara:strand:- start:2931 stop:3737 length:807 start_codon:yes stop_codon:yes gene_type:complete
MNIHANLKKNLLKFVETKDVPHIILHGPSGGGKRSILFFLIKNIYKNVSDYNKYIMYINCAHSKGIKFIRDELKFFAKTNIQKDNLSFKSIVLFNADKLTIDAQSALRRCIEEFSHTTRFFIVVENCDRLLKPIISRFCNIYIPLPTIDKKNISLHDFNNIKFNSHEKSATTKRKTWLTKKIEGGFINCSPQSIINIIDELYNKAYSAIDVMNVIEKTKKLENGVRFKMLIHFDNIKREFRSEKLLILYILTIAYLRNNNDLENIEEM